MCDDVPLAEQPRRLTGPLGLAAGNPWQIGTARWDMFYSVVFGGVVLVTVVIVAGPARVVALAALAAMLLWYLLLGRSYIARAELANSRRGPIFLAGLLPLFAVADWENPYCWFLAFALCPMCFHVLRARPAMWPAIAFNLVGGTMVALREPTATGYAQAIALVAFGVVFTQVYSGYVLGVVEQSLQQADLITQLDQTRTELALVSRDAGVLAERQRLAGEIHDTLAQGFSSILMLIQAAEAQLEESPVTARRQLALAAQTARENLAEARTLVGGLAPAQLRPGTLEDALRRITERLGSELGVSASFETSGTGRELPAATEVVLLRTGQEALANVRKHAAAGRVDVRLCYADTGVRLEVTDDGAGFDPAAVNGGYGLRGMRGRVDEAGGTIAVRSAPERGTSVTVEVPA
jgi:signal transduction histidine kinase